MAVAQAVMLVGPAGTGKTQLLMGALRKLISMPGSEYLMFKINVNYYTRCCS